jgi:hypothetical protein
MEILKILNLILIITYSDFYKLNKSIWYMERRNILKNKFQSKNHTEGNKSKLICFITSKVILYLLFWWVVITLAYWNENGNLKIVYQGLIFVLKNRLIIIKLNFYVVMIFNLLLITKKLFVGGNDGVNKLGLFNSFFLS